jgi:hypothetical protein
MLLMVVIISIVVGFIMGAVVGVGLMHSKINNKLLPRCEELKELSFGKDCYKVRCRLKPFHDGPHLHIVSNKEAANYGEELWWENKMSTYNILNDVTTDASHLLPPCPIDVSSTKAVKRKSTVKKKLI